MSEYLALFSSLISTVEMSKRRWLFTCLIVETPGSHVLFSVLVDSSLLLDGVPSNTEDGTNRACHLGDVLAFPRILLGIALFRVFLAGV